jgi:hypothetical protein
LHLLLSLPLLLLPPLLLMLFTWLCSFGASWVIICASM